MGETFIGNNLSVTIFYSSFGVEVSSLCRRLEAGRKLLESSIYAIAGLPPNVQRNQAQEIGPHLRQGMATSVPLFAAEVVAETEAVDETVDVAENVTLYK